MNENGFFTFGQEADRLSKLITKLHRYLKACLPSYASKCSSEVADYTDLTAKEEIAAKEIIQNATSVSSWTDFQGRKSYMFYVLGPLENDLFEPKVPEPVADQDPKITTQKIETPEEKASRLQENATVHFGRVEADPVALSQLH